MSDNNNQLFKNPESHLNQFGGPPEHQNAKEEQEMSEPSEDLVSDCIDGVNSRDSDQQMHEEEASSERKLPTPQAEKSVDNREDSESDQDDHEDQNENASEEEPE